MQVMAQEANQSPDSPDACRCQSGTIFVASPLFGTGAESCVGCVAALLAVSLALRRGAQIAAHGCSSSNLRPGRLLAEGSALANLASESVIAPQGQLALAIVSVSPAAGSTKILTNTAVAVQFNNPMNASTISTTTLVLRRRRQQPSGRHSELRLRQPNGDAHAERRTGQFDGLYAHGVRRQRRRGRCKWRHSRLRLHVVFHHG